MEGTAGFSAPSPQVGTAPEVQIVQPLGEPKQGAPPVGRRPNTISPLLIVPVRSEDLEALDDDQIRDFADRYIGIPIPAGTPRGVIMTRICNAAIGAIDSNLVEST